MSILIRDPPASFRLANKHQSFSGDSDLFIKLMMFRNRRSTNWEFLQ